MDQALQLTPDQAQQKVYTYLRTTYALPDAISKIITAQSGHETNGWTSNVYETLNNLFGYGYTGSTYTFYPYGIQDSIDDLVGWLDRHVPGYESMTDPADYAAAIRAKGYYTDSLSNYAAGVARWYNDNLQLAAGITVAGLVGVALLVVFLLKEK
jgi:hypothetical protein